MSSRTKSEEFSKKISTTVYLRPIQMKALQCLAKRTKVPFSVYLRQGIDAVLEKYQDMLDSQQERSFEIWRHTKSNNELLCLKASPEEAEDLRRAGFSREREFVAFTEQEAQAEFTKWCQSWFPNARVEEADLSLAAGDDT